MVVRRRRQLFPFFGFAVGHLLIACGGGGDPKTTGSGGEASGGEPRVAVGGGMSVAGDPAEVGGDATGGSAMATGGAGMATGVSVTVSPKATTVILSATLGLSAKVVGAVDTAVIWGVTEASGCGSVTPDGVYTAPSVMPSPAFCHVSAMSHADPSRGDSATLTISGGAG